VSMHEEEGKILTLKGTMSSIFNTLKAFKTIYSDIESKKGYCVKIMLQNSVSQSFQKIIIFEMFRNSSSTVPFSYILVQ